jgi:hypothetical protein
MPTIDVLNRCIPRTASSQDRVKRCAYPPCTSDSVAALGVHCDDAFGDGAWPICNSSTSRSTQCTAENAACQVQVESGSCELAGSRPGAVQPTR